MRCILISLYFLSASVQLWAQEVVVPDFSALTPIQRFAVDGLETESVLLGPAIDNVIAKIGLPDRIEIRKDKTRSDIDLAMTPANWMYKGFTVTTLFYSDCLLLNEETGKYGCGPYRDSRIVDRINVVSFRRESDFWAQNWRFDRRLCCSLGRAAARET